MTYQYLAFGIHIISEIELPALLPVNENETVANPVHVVLGTIPQNLQYAGTQADENTYCNANEMIFTIPEKIKFYISNGNTIVIEPISPNYRLNLLYFYSNCLAAILFQRNLIPFHVSGIFTTPGKVTLFAAPSKTGKSTLALKLQELGYKPFTDDTAVLYIENGKCYAQASYPMMRLWQNTLNQQNLLQEQDKQQLYEDDEVDKYGFPFHTHFEATPVEVEQIIFLRQEEIEQIEQKPIKNTDAFIELSNNVYRCHWIPAMQKNKVQFLLISQILNIVPYTLAVRPTNKNFIEEFALFIENILKKENE